MLDTNILPRNWWSRRSLGRGNNCDNSVQYRHCRKTKYYEVVPEAALQMRKLRLRGLNHVTLGKVVNICRSLIWKIVIMIVPRDRMDLRRGVFIWAVALHSVTSTPMV